VHWENIYADAHVFFGLERFHLRDDAVWLRRTCHKTWGHPMQHQRASTKKMERKIMNTSIEMPANDYSEAMRFPMHAANIITVFAFVMGLGVTLAITYISYMLSYLFFPAVLIEHYALTTLLLAACILYLFLLSPTIAMSDSSTLVAINAALLKRERLIVSRSKSEPVPASAPTTKLAMAT
jgi:hypothetical protein